MHTVVLQNLEGVNQRAENRVSAAKEMLDLSSFCIQTLQKEVKELKEHIDDFENRGRRKNLLIVGLPEGVEGARPEIHFGKWPPDFLQMEIKWSE